MLPRAGAAGLASGKRGQADVELRTLPSGTEVARLRVATTTRRRNGEHWVEKTNYFTVEVYGGQARAYAEHLGEGSRVLVDAELGWREWTDQEDKRREAVALRARQVLFEGGRPRTSDGDSEGNGSSTGEAEPGAPVGPSSTSQASASGEGPAVLSRRIGECVPPTSSMGG